MEIYQITLVIAVVLLIVEILLPSFFFASLSVSVFVLAAVHYASAEFVVARDLSIVGIGTTIAFFLFRRFFRARGDQVKHDKDLNRY